MRAAAAALALLAAACGPPGDGPARREAPSARKDAMGELDSAHPTLAVPVAAGEGGRFVVVEVAAVANPSLRPLAFDVAFRPPGGAARPLGLFSLYPADRPGRFIVAAQGQVRPGGEILVTMRDESPDPGAQALKDVRVHIATVALADR
ncbi:MAG: hypothetical protein ACJ8EB_04055 [Allosphingosinicella sp.]